jgi:sugar phosphate isomerase/epimerase
MDLSVVRQIREELEELSLPMMAVSGTCNLIHPDRKQRARDIARLQVLIGVCNQLGTSVVTLCTGTRDPLDMWRAHPDNESPAAWSDLRTSLELLLATAHQHQITLGVEPEAANVIASAQQARRLLDEVKSDFLKIVFDGANLVQPHGLAKQSAVLSQACDLLGPDIVLAHGKDLAGEKTVAVGKGGLDYGLYLSILERAGFDGPLILHSLTEAEVPALLAFLRKELAAVQSA